MLKFNMMDLDLIKIGNSRGIRLPAQLISKYGIEQGLKVDLLDKGILLSPRKSTPRSGWDAKFKALDSSTDKDTFLSDSIRNKFDDEDWEW